MDNEASVASGSQSKRGPTERVEIERSARYLLDTLGDDARIGRRLSGAWAALPVFLVAASALTLISLAMLIAFDHDISDVRERDEVRVFFVMLIILFGILLGVFLRRFGSGMRDLLRNEAKIQDTILPLLDTVSDSLISDDRISTDMDALRATARDTSERRFLSRLLPPIISIFLVSGPAYYVMRAFFFGDLPLSPDTGDRLFSGVFGVFSLAAYVIILYLFYSFMKEIGQYNLRLHMLARRLESRSSRHGAKIDIVSRLKTIFERDFVLYTAATIFTGGFFLFYWFYVLIRDYSDTVSNGCEFISQISGYLDQLISPSRKPAAE